MASKAGLKRLVDLRRTIRESFVDELRMLTSVSAVVAGCNLSLGRQRSGEQSSGQPRSAPRRWRQS